MAPIREFTSDTAREAFARAGFLEDNVSPEPEMETQEHDCAGCGTAGAAVLCTTPAGVEWRHGHCLPERTHE